MIGDGISTTLSKDRIGNSPDYYRPECLVAYIDLSSGLEIKMPSITCVGKRLEQFSSWSPTACLSLELKAVKYIKEHSVVSP